MSDARNEYADIIDRAHHVSKRRQPMPRLARAAQFSPFAALTGYDDLVSETARLTDEQVLLSEERKSSLNDVLSWLMSQPSPTEATFTYFVPDKTKAGGSYSNAAGRIKKFDASSRMIVLDTGFSIPIENLCGIECPAYEREQQSFSDVSQGE